MSRSKNRPVSGFLGWATLATVILLAYPSAVVGAGMQEIQNPMHDYALATANALFQGHGELYEDSVLYRDSQARPVVREFVWFPGTAPSQSTVLGILRGQIHDTILETARTIRIQIVDNGNLEYAVNAWWAGIPDEFQVYDEILSRTRTSSLIDADFRYLNPFEVFYIWGRPGVPTRMATDVRTGESQFYSEFQRILEEYERLSLTPIEPEPIQYYDPPDPPEEVIINGVPDYIQFCTDVDPEACDQDPLDCVYSGCCPTAASDVLHFWKFVHGYLNIPDDWHAMCYDLRENMACGCSATSSYMVAPGIQTTFADYGSCFDAEGIDCNGHSTAYRWDRIRPEVLNGRPAVLSILGGGYNSHCVTLIGYWYNPNNGNWMAIVWDNLTTGSDPIYLNPQSTSFRWIHRIKPCGTAW